MVDRQSMSPTTSGAHRQIISSESETLQSTPTGSRGECIEESVRLAGMVPGFRQPTRWPYIVRSIKTLSRNRGNKDVDFYV